MTPIRSLFLLILVLLAGFGCSRRYEPARERPFIIPPPPPAPLLPRKTIILDAGHGGDDTGCQHEAAEVCNEKDLTLQTVKIVKRHLDNLGYHVVLTRTNDNFVSLDDRAEIANSLKASLFVSVHFNAATSKTAQGIEVYYHEAEHDHRRTNESKQLAKAIHDKVKIFTEAPSRGVKTGNYRVIRNTNMPAILIEGGFLTHPEERERCKDPIYLNALAWGIARGVHDYYEDPPKEIPAPSKPPLVLAKPTEKKEDLKKPASDKKQLEKKTESSKKTTVEKKPPVAKKTTTNKKSDSEKKPASKKDKK